MQTLAILVAAGRGERMGAGRPKAFVALGGEPLLLRAARAFEAARCIDGIVAVVPPQELEPAEDMLKHVRKKMAVVSGGERRQDSVRVGLAAVPTGFDGVVLVHDAARALIEPDLIEAVAAAAHEHGAALPVLPIVDTVKRVRLGTVFETLEREELAAAQTPQGFRYPVITRAYEAAFREGLLVTDEAMAVERIGERVVAIPGSTRNRKITTPEDLAWAEDVLRGER